MKRILVILAMLLAMNASAQWVQMANGINMNSSVDCFKLNGANIYAGTIGISLTTNYGVNWTQTGFSGGVVYSIEVIGNTILAGTSSGVLRSSNNGINWSTTSLNNYPVYAVFNYGSAIYAGVYASGIYKSINDGISWSSVYYTPSSPTSFTVNGGNLFAGTFGAGVYISTNGGASWTQTALNNKSVWCLASNSNTIFAGTFTNGLYRSTDNGTTWTQSFANESAWSLAVSGNNVFVGTNASGIYLSTNNGLNWIQKNEGFNRIEEIDCLLIAGDYIFAGIFHNSVWRRLLSELTGTQNISTETPSKYSLSQNYPNPFNSTSNLKFQIVNSGDVKLIVYDIMGKEVQTLVNERLQPGTYEATFDASSLNSGVYFYKLITNGFTETKKMLLIK